MYCRRKVRAGTISLASTPEAGLLRGPGPRSQKVVLGSQEVVPRLQEVVLRSHEVVPRSQEVVLRSRPLQAAQCGLR